MNTRIQVEHPVTEEITGIDLIDQQIRIARGETLPKQLDRDVIQGHAIELRLYAEQPGKNFQPSPGRINYIEFSGNNAVRIESCLQAGDRIEPDFDPMLMKLIVKGKNRSNAIDKLHSALENNYVQGVHTNKNFLLALLRDKAFLDNQVSTEYVNSFLKKYTSESDTHEDLLIHALAGLYLTLEVRDNKLTERRFNVSDMGFWRARKKLRIKVNQQIFEFTHFGKQENQFFASHLGDQLKITVADRNTNNLVVHLHDKTWYFVYSWCSDQNTLYLSSNSLDTKIIRSDWLSQENIERKNKQSATKNSDTLVRAPLNGRIVKLNCIPKDVIDKGESILSIESMKMENEIRLPYRGRVAEVFVSEGTVVKEGDLLIELEKT